MLKGNRCEVCEATINGRKAQHKQTKYCVRCAKKKKRANSLDPWHPLDRKDYMREYMRKYRGAHPRLSTRYVRAHRKRKKLTQAPHGNSPHGLAHLKSSSQVLYSASAVALFFMLLTLRHSEAISFEALQVFIGRCSATVVELTGLVVILLFSWRHVRGLWREIK